MASVSGPVENRQPKHLVIYDKVKDLMAVVEDLEGLVNLVDPVPPSPATAQPPSGVPSLCFALNQLPADLMILQDRISKSVEVLRAKLF